MAKRVLYLSSGRLAAYHWHRGTLRDPLWFTADEEGLTDFSLYLNHSNDEPAQLLVDIVEEDFREESIPHVSGADRRALVSTKLNRLFRDATYANAIFQGREEEGRRDDVVLFSALIRPDLLAPWIGQLAKHKVPLSGIYSLPILSQQLVKMIPDKGSHVLLVTLQSSGGLRQSFFHDGKIKLSRLAVTSGAERSSAGYILSEVEKIRRYLNSLRQLPEDDPLDVYVLAERSLLADITRRSPDSLTTRHHLLDIEDMAKKLGITARYEDPYADRLFAHILAKRAPKNHYAPRNQTRYFGLHRVRLGLVAASLLLLATSIAFSGLKFVGGIVANEDTKSVKTQIEFYQQRVDQRRSGRPPLPAEPVDIKAAVELVDILEGYKTSPTPMMVLLGQALQRYPTLQIEELQWTASTNPNEDPRGRVEGEGRRRVQESSTTLYQIARIRGYIDPFTDLAAAADVVYEFRDALQAMANVEQVLVEVEPFNVEDIITNAGAETSLTAPFQLRIVLTDRSRVAG